MVHGYSAPVAQLLGTIDNQHRDQRRRLPRGAGIWHLWAGVVWQRQPSPAALLRDATGGLWAEIAQRLGRWIFILPVLAFTGKEPDRDIEARSGLARVHVIKGTERFVERLMELAEPSGLFDPPTAKEIEADNEAITSGEETAPAPSSMDISARQVVIQRADVVNVYATGPDAYE